MNTSKVPGWLSSGLSGSPDSGLVRSSASPLRDPCVTPPSRHSVSPRGYFQRSTSTTQSYFSSTQLIGAEPTEQLETVAGCLGTGKLGAGPAAEVESDKNRVKHVILLKPGEDAEKATAKAINDIADSLNRKAAERLALGHTPEKETVIEITRIQAPAGESEVRLPALASQCAPASSSLASQWRPSTDHQLTHRHHRRKSPHPKRHMYTTPTPPKAPPTTEPVTEQCYFRGAAKRVRGCLAPVSVSQPTPRVPTVNKGPAILRPVNCPSKPSLTGLTVTGLAMNNLAVRDMRPAGRVDGGKVAAKRPPYSYMHLIQMAISSRPDGRMTLRDIYAWIEDQFPYYKAAQHPGWKNSIRHNLSLYDMFVRVKSKELGKSGCSYWTLRSDLPAQTTRSIHAMTAAVQRHPGSQTGAASTNKKTQRGPVPLLPKPATVQTLTLIPVQHRAPLILSPWQPATSLPSLRPAPGSERKIVKRNLAQTEMREEAGPRAKLVKMGWASPSTTPSPQRSSPQLSSAPDISPRATSPRACSPQPSSSPRPSSTDTSQLRHQLSLIKFDSGVDMTSDSDSLLCGEASLVDLSSPMQRLLTTPPTELLPGPLWSPILTGGMEPDSLLSSPHKRTSTPEPDHDLEGLQDEGVIVGDDEIVDVGDVEDELFLSPFH